LLGAQRGFFVGIATLSLAHLLAGNSHLSRNVSFWGSRAAALLLRADMSTTTRLGRLTIANPCPVSWERMTGDSRVRFCSECKLNVYNLSSMMRDEAEELLREKEGRLCVRFYERADGTVLTQACPAGVAAARRAVARTAALAAGFVALLLGFVGLMPVQPGTYGKDVSLSDIEPVKSVVEWLFPARGCWVAGEAPRLPPPPANTPQPGQVDEDDDLP
jgi:hypothetical protein